MTGDRAYETRLAASSSFEEIGAAFEAELTGLGYTYYDFGSIDHARIDEGPGAYEYFKCNYFEGDYQSYLPRNWPLGDPTFAAMVAGAGPVDYHAMLRSSKLTVITSLQLGILNVWNIRHAWLMPYNTPGHVRFATVYMKGTGHGTAFERTRDRVFLLGALTVARADAVFCGTRAATGPGPEIDFTGEELACFKVLMTGASNPEIAQTLGVSVDTVRYHLKKVFRKLDVRSRTQAVAKAQRLGITVKQD